jgi:hypothetical protein
MNQGLEAQLTDYLRRYRNDGVLLDTNVLLLLWLSSFDPSLVGGKRLEKYSYESAALLQHYVGQFSRVLTTHTILAETSNLAALVLGGRRKKELFTQLYPFFGANPPQGFHHCSLDGLELIEDVFVPLGFTDATVVAALHAPPQRLLLTDDLDLYLAAVNRGAHALNFTHMCDAAGLL